MSLLHNVGNLSKEEIKTDIDKRFSEIKKEYDDEHNINLKRCYFTWFTIISLIIIFNVSNSLHKYILENLNLDSGFYLLCILLVYGIFFGTTKYKGDWLHEIY